MNEPSQPKIRIISKTSDFSFDHTYYELADESHFWIQWRFAVLVHQLRYLNIPLDQEMLGCEIGCGHGLLRRQVHKATGWTIDGIELDMDGLKRNPQQPGQLFYYNILEKNKELEQKYDFVFLYDVLEHIEETQPFLEACLFHLKKGGYVFANVPALKSLTSAYDHVQGHFRRYNKQMLSRELTDVHLKILDIKYWGFFLVPLLYLRKMVLSQKQSNEDVMTKGLKPPNQLVHGVLKILMCLETGLLRRVPVGTSVMAAARKE